MEQTVIWNREYTVENHTLVNLRDEDGTIDYTSTLFYRARIRVVPKDETVTMKEPLTETALQDLTVDAVSMTYMREYGDGMPISVLQNGKPEEALTAKIMEYLEEPLFLHYGAAAVFFAVDDHRIPEADRQKLDQLLRMKELRDPKKAAEALLQATREKAAQYAARNAAGNAQPQKELPPWICTCGSVNSSKFCPECGKSSGRWLCTCGNLNTTPFCPECGSPAKNGTHV